jgi:hypothetical protein
MCPLPWNVGASTRSEPAVLLQGLLKLNLNHICYFRTVPSCIISLSFVTYLTRILS